MLCILYVILLSTWFGLVGLIAEGALPSRVPRRWVWCVTIAVSLIVPPIFKARHSTPIRQILEHDMVRRAAGALGSSGTGTPFVLLDPERWATASRYEFLVNPLWLFASTFVLALGLLHAARASRLVRRPRTVSAASRGPTYVDGVRVIVTNKLGPATIGLFGASIVIPAWVLDLLDLHRGFVLRHEEEHRASRDPLLLFLVSLAIVLTPWNVPLYWQMRRFRLAVETDCDERVVRALGNRAAYAAFLLGVAEGHVQDSRLRPSFIGQRGSLERRLRGLVAEPKHWALTRVVAPVLILSLLWLAFTTPHPVEDAHARHGAVSARAVMPVALP